MKFANTEFYYIDPSEVKSIFSPSKEESKHILQVMRHKIGDRLFFTDGCGNLYETELQKVIGNNQLEIRILSKSNCTNNLMNIFIFLPLLKSSDKIELALEKCIELGFTKFIIFNADKSYKRSVKIERWNRLALAAMKQSLQSFLPKIEYLNNISQYNFENSSNIIFDQLSEKPINEIITEIDYNRKINLIFGPEAGLTEKDISKIPNKSFASLNLSRLRSETAVISAAAIVSNYILFKKNIL